MEKDTLTHTDPLHPALPLKSLQNPLPSIAALLAPEPVPRGAVTWGMVGMLTLGMPSRAPGPCMDLGVAGSLCSGPVESWLLPPGPSSSPSLPGVSLRKGLY